MSRLSQNENLGEGFVNQQNTGRRPKSITYPTIPPTGFPAKYKQWRVNPTQSTSFNKDELVRLEFTGTNHKNAFIDPYATWINVTVEADANQLGDAGLVLDGPPQVLFEQQTIFSNGREVERHQKMNHIARMADKLGIFPNFRRAKEYKGQFFDGDIQNKHFINHTRSAI